PFRARADETAIGNDALCVAAAKLAQELREAWSRGESTRAEDFLARCPELRQQPTSAMEVIYEEVLLRQEHGQQDGWTELFQRFPQWREHLEALRECHEVIEGPQAPVKFPAIGETIGEFRLVAELGRGALARVFLASQRSLADRPVVLKITPRSGREH